MALSQEQLQQLYGFGALGSGLGSLFGGNKSPADAAMKYINKIPGQAGKYYDPYIQAGQGALPALQEQYSSLLGSPGEKLNEIGANYKQSPGFQFALDQALGSANRASAAGGMAGSPQSQQQNMGIATGLANQDYNNWLQQATGLYGQGLTGEQGMASMGQQGAKSMSDLIAQQLAQQAAYTYQGQSAKNESSPWGSIAGGLGMLGAFNPILGAIGGGLGHLFGGK